MFSGRRKGRAWRHQRHVNPGGAFVQVPAERAGLPATGNPEIFPLEVVLSQCPSFPFEILRSEQPGDLGGGFQP